MARVRFPAWECFFFFSILFLFFFIFLHCSMLLYCLEVGPKHVQHNLPGSDVQVTKDALSRHTPYTLIHISSHSTDVCQQCTCVQRFRGFYISKLIFLNRACCSAFSEWTERPFKSWSKDTVLGFHMFLGTYMVPS